jgi:hypothetical protein
VNPNEYRYITVATDRLLSLCGDSWRRPIEDLALAATQACEALKRLQKQQPFRKLIDQAERDAFATAQEREDLRAELASLATAFLDAEADALTQMGHDEDNVKQILWMAGSCQDAVSHDLSAEALAGRIHNLELACCRAATELHKVGDARTRRRLLGRITFGMAGVSVMVADLVALPPSGATSIGSVLIAGEMIGKSLG